MADPQITLPKGFEDAAPVQQSVQLPSGYEDAQPKSAAPTATISAYHEPKFTEHPLDYLTNKLDQAEEYVRYGPQGQSHFYDMPGINRGVSPGVAQFMGGAVMAPIDAGRTGVDVAGGHPIKAINHAAKTVGDLALPAAIAAPGMLPLLAPRIGGAMLGGETGTKAAEAVGIEDPDYKELAGNIGGAVGAGAPEITKATIEKGIPLAQKGGAALVRGAAKGAKNVINKATSPTAIATAAGAKLAGPIGAGAGAILGSQVPRFIPEIKNMPGEKFGLPKPTKVAPPITGEQQALPLIMGEDIGAQSTVPKQASLFDEAPKAETPVAPSISSPREAIKQQFTRGGEMNPAEEGQRTLPMKAEGAKRVLGQYKHVNGESLDQAIPQTSEGHALRDKLFDLKNSEVEWLARNNGLDLGTQSVGGRAGQMTRAEVFNKLLEKNTPDQLSKMVDEGKHLPPVRGGSQSADEDSQWGFQMEPAEKVALQKPQVGFRDYMNQEDPDVVSDHERPSVASPREAGALADRYTQQKFGGQNPEVETMQPTEERNEFGRTEIEKNTQDALANKFTRDHFGRIEPGSLTAVEPRHSGTNDFQFGEQKNVPQQEVGKLAEQFTRKFAANSGLKFEANAENGGISVKDQSGKEVGGIKTFDVGDAWRISSSGLPDSAQGMGLGQKLYQEMFNMARDAGKKYVESGGVVSEKAASVWRAMAARGIPVEETKVRSATSEGDSGSTFRVKLEKPPALKAAESRISELERKNQQEQLKSKIPGVRFLNESTESRK